MSGKEPTSGSFIWAAAFVVLAGVCLCSGLCLAPLSWTAYQATTQRADIETLIDDCLRDIDANDADAALTRFSSRAIREGGITREQLQQLADNPAYQDYDDLVANNMNIGMTFNTSPKVPQGTTTKVTGTIAYTNGDAGDFTATLERDNQQWRLHSLDVQRKVL